MNRFLLKTMLATLTLLSISMIQSSHANDFANPVPSRSPAEALQGVANRMIADPESIQSLRPTYGECRQIASDQTNALKIWYYAIEFYELVKSKGGLPLKNNPESAVVIPGSNNSSQMSTVQTNLAESYRQGSVWFTVKFKKSDQAVGSFSGFAKVNGRWIFIPRFYDSFSAKKVPSASLTVLKMLDSNMTDDLYEFSSPRLTEQMDRKKAVEFFARLGFSKIKNVNPQTRGTRLVHDRQIFQQGMNVDFENGRAAAVNMIFDIDENKDVCLAWIAIQSRLGVDAPSLFAPLPGRCRKLAVDLLGKVNKALDTRDFSKLHSESAKALRNKMNVEQLTAAFPEGNEVLAQVLQLDPSTLKVANPPALGKYDAFQSGKMTFRPDEERIPLGPLVVKTVISTKTGKQLGATFEFYFEDKTWKPSGYSFYPLKK